VQTVSRVFAEPFYWIALLNEKDEAHAAAKAMSETLQPATIVTTQEVLSEVLTYFCAHGPHVRQSATAFARAILSDPAITVHPQSARSFLNGLGLYEARPDKHYSLTDCISMLVMRREGMTDVLTGDDHFRQEGLTILL
jgi:predicted nucleic acid-binding protein